MCLHELKKIACKNNEKKLCIREGSKGWVTCIPDQDIGCDGKYIIVCVLNYQLQHCIEKKNCRYSIELFDKSLWKGLTAFLAHLSQRLFWSKFVCCCCCCLNFSSSSPEPLSQFFNQIWHKVSLGEGDSSLLKWRALFQGEIIMKLQKCYDEI